MKSLIISTIGLFGTNEQYKRNKVLFTVKNQILALFVTLLYAATFAQTSKHINVKDKIAIQGYDPVAYFESAKAIEGKKEITTEYKEAIYQFSSESNKALFLKNPTHYVPQFGGYCAYGMSEGYEAPVKPEAFTIVENKLYINYDLKVKEMWLKEQTARIEKAAMNWDKIQKE